MAARSGFGAREREWIADAVAGYTRAGESAAWIARRLDIAQRTVERYRARLREQGRLRNLTPGPAEMERRATTVLQDARRGVRIVETAGKLGISVYAIEDRRKKLREKGLLPTGRIAA